MEEDSVALRRAYFVDLNMWLDIFQAPKARVTAFIAQQEQITPEIKKGVNRYIAQGGLRRDCLFMIDTMEKYIQAAELPYPDRFRQGRNISVRVEQAKVITNYNSVNIISGMVLPSDGKALLKDAVFVATSRITRAAIWVELYRHAYGRLPESLSQLVPEFGSAVPVDPFDGKEVRYKRLPRGFVVYSVGKDEKDDGGKEAAEATRDQGDGDITFVVER